MNKLLRFLIVLVLISALLGFGINAFASVHSKWSAGDLVFYDGATDIFSIRYGTSGAKIFDDLNLTFGTDNDATIIYDETTDNKFEITCSNGLTFTGAVVKFVAQTSIIHEYDAGDYVTQTVADGGAVKVTVTGAVSGTYEIETDDGAIILDAAATITLDAGTGNIEIIGTAGIDFTGTVATGIAFHNATFVPTSDRTDIAVSVGTRANALTITLANEVTQHFEPIQVNIDVAGVNPSSTSDVSLMRMQSTHTTAAMNNLRLRHINSYMVIEQDIQAAYIYTGSLDLMTNAIAVTTEVAVMNLNLEIASAVTGDVRGLIINMYGANLAGADSIGLEVRTDGGASVLDEGIRIWSVGSNSITTALDVRGTITYFADFDNVSGAAGTVCTESGTAATIWAGRIKVQTPDGNDAWVNVYSTSNE